MQFFVEKADNTRMPIDQMTADALRQCHGYRNVIATDSMTVVRNTSLKRRVPMERHCYGGGRLRNPYE